MKCVQLSRYIGTGGMFRFTNALPRLPPCLCMSRIYPASEYMCTAASSASPPPRKDIERSLRGASCPMNYG